MHTSHMQKQHIQYNVAGRSIVAHSNQSNAPACLRRHLIACIFVLLFGVLCSRVLPHVCGGWLPPCLPVHTHTQAHIIFYPFLVSLGAQARSNNPSLLIRCARSGCRRCARGCLINRRTLWCARSPQHASRLQCISNKDDVRVWQ